MIHQLRACVKSPNPTHGSGWIVQVQPTKREATRPPFLFLSSQTRGKERKGRITGRASVLSCRLDLNNPPTCRGWDLGFFTQSQRWWDYGSAWSLTVAGVT